MAVTTAARSTSQRPALAGVATPRPAAFLVFATWCLGGLYLDGWSHRNDKPETFFSPWHGVLYSGFAAGMAYFAFQALRSARSAKAVAAPAGGDVVVRHVATKSEKLARAGIVLFVAGGFGDSVWHQVLGVEANIGALLSPTHLALMLGGISLGAGELLVWWEGVADADVGDIRRTAYGAGLAASIVVFFTMFLSPFLRYELPTGEDAIGGFVAGVLLSTVLLVGPTLLLGRRWPLPAGSAVLAVAPSVVCLLVLEAGRLWALCLAPLAGALVAEALLAGARGDGPLTPAVARRIGGLVPVVTWTAYYGLQAARGEMAFEAEVWSGSVVLAAVVGVGLSLLAVPPPTDPAT